MPFFTERAPMSHSRWEGVRTRINTEAPLGGDTRAHTSMCVHTHRTRDRRVLICIQGNADRDTHKWDGVRASSVKNTDSRLHTHLGSRHLPPHILCSWTPEPEGNSGGLNHSSADPSSPFPAQPRAPWASAPPLPGGPGEAAPRPSLGLQFPTPAS